MTKQEREKLEEIISTWKEQIAVDKVRIEQLKQVCHYTNLQPMWARDNLSKGAKLWELK